MPMRTSVAQFLEGRLSPDAILLEDAVVAAPALPMLRAGMIGSLEYRDGRLLGHVGLRTLLAAGYLEVAQRWLAAGAAGACPQLRQAIDGAPLTALELGEVGAADRVLLALTARARGGGLSADDRAALLADDGHALDDDGARLLRVVLDDPAIRFTLPLSDEAVEPLPAGLLPGADALLATGDVAGSLRELAARVAQASAEEATTGQRCDAWPDLAEASRLLHDDEAEAVRCLEHLGFAQGAERWRKLLGERGVARVAGEQRALLATIDEAFDGVPFPGPEHASLYQAEAADDYERCDQARDHKGRWQALPREQLLACQWALPHLPAESLPYYLPAMMSLAVREAGGPDRGAGLLFHALEHTLKISRPARPATAHHVQARYRLFTAAQLGAVARFAAYVGASEPDRAAWRVVTDGGAWPSARPDGPA